MISYPSVAGVEEGGGLLKIPWVSLRRRWGRRRYHGSPYTGSGVIEDTMGLLSREVGS